MRRLIYLSVVILLDLALFISIIYKNYIAMLICVVGLVVSVAMAAWEDKSE